LLEALAAAAAGTLDGVDLTAGSEAAVTVVLAARGYPDRPETGAPIGGLTEAEDEGAVVFHAGTAFHDGSLVSAGGRVLNVTGLGSSVADAREQAYRAVERIELAGVHYRNDIALRAVHAAA
jgi:phosphoribosylamine---glycine ligase